MHITFLKRNSKQLRAHFAMLFHSMVALQVFHQQKALFDRDS
jgi:hypothetical protein